jgi:hypothetical protein
VIAVGLSVLESAGRLTSVFPYSVHLCNVETQIVNRLKDLLHRCLAVAGTA